MTWYNSGKAIMLDPSLGAVTIVGEPPFALLLDRIVPGLMRDAYTFDADHNFYDDVTAQGIVATDYVEPGNASSLELATKTVVQDDGTDQGEFDAADLEYTGIGNGSNDTIDELVITREQDASITEANTILVAHVDLGGATTTNNGNITLVWNSNGILQIT